MAVSDDLIRSIQNAIAHAKGLQYNEPAQTNDVFENYIWALCIHAARSDGARVRYEAVDGTPATTALIFRTSPGSIYSTSSMYTHAVLDFAGCPALECHVGVRVSGKSGVLHECDVAVIYKDEADFCRQGQFHPRASQVLIALECKFYASSIDLHLGRSFLGLTKEIHTRHRYFVTNSSSPAVRKLIMHHKGEWEFDVIPGGRRSYGLLESLSRVFRDYSHSF